MSGQKALCNLFAKGSCRYGGKCKFSHERTGAAKQASSSRVATPSRAGMTNVPPRVCKLFWESGSCSRGFECTFKHQRPSSSVTTDSAETVNGDESPDFFSPDGLAINTGCVQEDSHTMRPSEAHNHIKAFLAKNYVFQTAAQVQGFVRILASVDDRNKNWSTESAQDFLDFIVKGNGILRIGDVLRYEPVNHMIGSHGGVLSFQKGYFPVFEFFTSNLILKSTLHRNINHLFTVLENNYDQVEKVIRTCLGGMISARTWKDTTPNLAQSLQNKLGGVVVFRTLFSLLFQFVVRFKEAIRTHTGLVTLIMDLGTWFDRWADDVTSSRSRFDDSITNSDSGVRKLTIAHLREDIDRLKVIAEREIGKMAVPKQQTAKSVVNAAYRREALASQMAQTYDPPGDLRTEGRRHDNDHASISSIRIAPTQNELFSPVRPYLPIVLPEAPHHLPQHSMERHLDIQFRLLREELIGPVRSSVAAVNDDLVQMHNNQKGRKITQLEQLLQKKGGPYRTSGHDSVFFYVYANVHLSRVKAERREIAVELWIDTPSGAARDTNAKQRYEFWEHGKRLQSGTLVALVLVNKKQVRVFLGVVTSSGTDIAESSKVDNKRVQIRVSFFDAEIEFMALRGKKITLDKSTFALLVDNAVMYESMRPFLERMRTIEPTEVPFTRYISRNDSLASVTVEPPRYTVAPSFRYHLQCLAKKGHRIDPLNVSQPSAVTKARRQLYSSSELDPSQVDAVVDTLTREVSLIQGPPGTGKSFTAKEILRILFASKVKPVVLIAYTNHALDHLLNSILDAGITRNFVRLGSRSTDARIMEYTLDKLEGLDAASSLDRSIKHRYADMKKNEESLEKVMRFIQTPSLTWDRVKQYLAIQYAEQMEHFLDPPYWIQKLADRIWEDEDENGEWITAGKQKRKYESTFTKTFYGLWKAAHDLHFITPPAPSSKPKGRTKSKKEAQAQELKPEVAEFFTSLGFESQIPPLPTSNRPINKLLVDSNVWSMSLAERSRLALRWEDEIRAHAYDSHITEYENLRKTYIETCKEWNDAKDENRRRLLSRTELIACTTTGAAKLTSLLSSIAPRVLIVEEAGQVLEAHILSSLVSSVHHLICIGDPLQLRPTLATFALSMDSERGRTFFKFDMSLMERLATSGLPMSQINTQRRMRPVISDLIRTILYPNLQDHSSVKDYPAVQGIQKNIYFLDHTNKESGSEESVSKYNMFEVDMIRELVCYFLKQGCYSGQGDIAVLCAYLGQLQKVRAALRNLKIAVAVDERDEDQLARQGIEEECEYEQVALTKHVRLGTVDIFQGQEAKIVIVSLVRNSGDFNTEAASIGFLKSSNRINVALSRAKHGLYMLGNAANLKRNQTWSTIINKLECQDLIGPSLPIICPRHHDQAKLVSRPEELKQQAPEGGCLLPCGMQLPCGHVCPSVCHDLSKKHRDVKCDMPCNRISCTQGHPCSRRCSDDCGKCEFPIYKVKLPCGHVKDRIPCYMQEELGNIKCTQQIQKKLPGCAHSAAVPCHKDASSVRCTEPCGGTLQCCTKTCKAKCSDCRVKQTEASTKGSDMIGVVHKEHLCERPLYCQHKCGLPCSQEHHCNNRCKQDCRQQCDHYRCSKPCSTPCPPCMEPCSWKCAHHSCPVLCGSICSRLPCDLPCSNVLPCGHSCPSVCGEPCHKQVCIRCLPQDRQADIVDLVMQRSLREMDLDSADTSERIITLECDHIFTVETLDGHCGMKEYYIIDEMGKFLATKAPPINYQTPPTCPTCRGPITALRYGRITKRATLDILEQNVASTMSQSLETLNPVLERIITNLDDMKKSVADIASDEEIPEIAPAKLDKRIDEPLPAEALQSDAMHVLHGFPPLEAQTWCKVVKPLIEAYKRSVTIAKTRGAHSRAYEAALTTLYRLEMEKILNDTSNTCTAPEPLAMDAVNRSIGQPPHKADTRFQIDAYLLSLELRYMIADIGCSRVEGLPLATDSSKHQQLWRSFIERVYESCKQDALIALQMATNSSSFRQAARCATQLLRIDFECMRFKNVQTRRQLAAAGMLTTSNRQSLAAEVTAEKSALEKSVKQASSQYLRSRPSMNMQDLINERKWFYDNCERKAQRWINECDELEKHMLNDKFYQPISLQEKEDIVKSFGFSHRGHFYNCENGHTFVITECGGAMQTAVCPECGAPIGGSNHDLRSSNTRATEFEAIAGRQGSLPGVFTWTRDA